MELVTDVTLVLVAALIGGLAARWFRQPLIVGYILAGVAVGPFTGGFTVAHVDSIEQLAELGVALLLFSLGLEVSFRELAPVRAVAIGGAAIQLVLTIAFGFGIGAAFGWPWRHAIWLGALIALSSTMVALKTLQAQGRVGTLSSRVMLGMLVVQDLAVVPLMIVLPALNNPFDGATRVVLSTARAFLLLAATVVVATRVVPRLMAAVARWNSRELFLIATTTVAFGVGYAAWAFGLSLALGAFIAGLVINESEYAHQALSDVVPLRDLFGMLFFVSIGMLLDPAFVWRRLDTLLLLIAIVTVGKAAIFAAVVRAFGYRRVVPLAVGLTLFQVGEFTFVLARVGVTGGAISTELYALVLNTTVATMALTPAISGMTPWLYDRVFGGGRAEPLQASNIPDEGLMDHIVVAGAGRIGCTIADALAAYAVPCVLVEVDARRAARSRVAGRSVIYGDAGQPIVLEAADLARARALIVTVPAFPEVRAIIRTARQLRPDLVIIARADNSEAVRDLRGLGINGVISPEFEGAIEMTREALAQVGMSPEDVARAADIIRQQRYADDAPPI